LTFISGLLIGFGTAFIIGPVFFTLLKNAHNHGVKGGLYTALGIILSDIIAVSLCYFFASQLLDEYIDQAWIKIAAAGVLIFLGIKFIQNQVMVKLDENETGAYHYFKSFYQGFFVNLINPAVFVIWITYIGIGKSTYANSNQVWIYLTGILVGIFITDVLKSYGSEYLLRKLNSKWLVSIFKTIGIILLVLAFRLIYMAYLQYA
jgi:threonine/homoserine/homoserine lactone efflux protein